MSYSAPSIGELPPVFLSSMSNLAAGKQFAGQSGAPSSSAWSTTNRIIYVPFTLPVGVTVYRYFWCNGATASTNNFQVGVYDTAFSRVHAGTSTLASGASVCQFDNITDYFLPAGRYYMAMWGSGTTATIMRIANVAGAGIGRYYQTIAGGLPTTGTPADPGATVSGELPLFGLALRATDP